MEKQEIDVQENLLLIRGEYREKFEAFRAYLLEFNGRYNLTAITEEKAEAAITPLCACYAVFGAVLLFQHYFVGPVYTIYK